jgi:cytochrome b
MLARMTRGLSRVNMKAIHETDARGQTMRQMLTTKVWDAPIRLFHWGIVVLIAVSWVSQEMNWMEIHFLSGYTMFAALLFRVGWGVVGSDTARFSRFLRSPVAALRHLAGLRRREPDTEIGHNAAGGWMVLLMLVLLTVQVGTGLCANDDIASEGPFSRAVGKDWSDWLSHVHSVNFTLIEIAIVAHLLAILAYAVIKRHNLVWPMITGRKRLPGAVQAPRMASPGLAAAVFVVAACCVWVVVRYGGTLG